MPELNVLQQLWFHTSTQPSWPDADWDPTASWNAEGFERMERWGGHGSTERWRAKQLTKCLHVGTLTAALESMERRRSSHAESDKQFWLYRVRLAANALVRPEPIADRESKTMGDVWPDDVMKSQESIARYVNEYEHKGSVSLALRRSAVAAVQRVPVPANFDKAALLASFEDAEWEDRSICSPAAQTQNVTGRR